jgi:hypothetical protein
MTYPVIVEVITGHTAKVPTKNTAPYSSKTLSKIRLYLVIHLTDGLHNTRWFKYDRDCFCVNKSQFVPDIFEPFCTYHTAVIGRFFWTLQTQWFRIICDFYTAGFFTHT